MSEKTVAGRLLDLFLLFVFVVIVGSTIQKGVDFVSSNLWTIITVLLVVAVGVYLFFFHKDPGGTDKEDTPNDYF